MHSMCANDGNCHTTYMLCIHVAQAMLGCPSVWMAMVRKRRCTLKQEIAGRYEGGDRERKIETKCMQEENYACNIGEIVCTFQLIGHSTTIITTFFFHSGFHCIKDYEKLLRKLVNPLRLRHSIERNIDDSDEVFALLLLLFSMRHTYAARRSLIGFIEPLKRRQTQQQTNQNTHLKNWKTNHFTAFTKKINKKWYQFYVSIILWAIVSRMT